MMLVYFLLNMSAILVNNMGKNSRFFVAKCATEKTCKKCSAIDDAIVVNKGPHTTLYCGKCGSYLKHASISDKRYIYGVKIDITDETPIKVCTLYAESEKTMFN